MAAITGEYPNMTVSGSRIYETVYNVRKCYWRRANAFGS